MSATTTSCPIDTAAMQQEAGAVEAFLAKAVAARPLPANLRAATEYALLGGGKRLRPMLVLRCCRAVGGSDEQAMPAAGAIELIHTFSLVHDDLPAMDDDDLRRGRPTLHKATNEAMAILAGDLMSSFAFELVATHLPLAVAGPVMHELAVATNDMIAGQVYDTLPDFDADVAPMDRLRTVHRNKTGALIRCSCRIGAICGNADAAQLDALTRYGEAIGLMFQIVDDLLDVTQTTEHLGKTAGKDAAQGKLTYPGLIGLDASRREVERLRREALEAIKGFGEAGGPLRELVQMMATRTK
jgi:geranylgeranyl pyrophosphate synthase